MRLTTDARITYRVVDYDDRFVWLKQNTMFLFANKVAIPREKVSSVATTNPLFTVINLVGGERYEVAPGIGKQRALTRDALAPHGVDL